MEGPAWIENLKLRLKTSNLIILDGNIEDTFFVPFQDENTALRLPELLANLTKENELTPIYAVPSDYMIGDNQIYKVIRNPIGDINGLLRTIKSEMQQSKVSLGIIIQADPFFVHAGDANEQAAQMFMNMIVSMKQMKLQHTVFLITSNQYSLPSHMQRDIPMRYCCSIQKPDLRMRRSFSEAMLRSKNASDAGKKEEVIKEQAMLIAQISEGMFLQDLISIFESNKEKEIVNRIRLMANGVRQDPWDQVDEKLLQTLENNLNKILIGQTQAVQKVTDKILGAASILSTAAFQAGDNTPRLKMILAGPSGVGKTETAKQICKQLYGDENLLIRIDLTEFTTEADCYRLIGAPPGYIGHERAGTLTGAALENPARLFLFDEFSKAHPKFLELLYQMLSDGRLTDSHGQTASFALSTLIFTTNLGANEVEDLPKECSAEEKHQLYCNVIRSFFVKNNMVPVYERFSDSNIVEYAELGPENIKKIFVLKLQKELENLHKYSGIIIHVGKDAFRFLLKELKDVKTGHGVNTFISNSVKEPLSRTLLGKKGRKINVTKAVREEGHIVFEVEVEE